MVTSSPTRMPPVSSAAFQLNPKSFRLIFVLAETATRVLPQGSLLGGVGPSTAKLTFRVTPWMVSSPSTDNSPSLTIRILLDLKVRVGTFRHQRNRRSSGGHRVGPRPSESRQFR